MGRAWLIGGAVAGILVAGGALAVSAFRSVGDNQGYEPDQPIDFSHKIHAGDNQIACLYCHSGAERSRHAGVPSASLCMNCHNRIRPDSAEIEKVKAALTQGRPIEWVKVHRLADFVAFSHEVHIASGKLACQSCHGPVEQMARMRQENNLTMGWCIDCHRNSNVVIHAEEPSAFDPRKPTVAEQGGTDCAKCHY